VSGPISSQLGTERQTRAAIDEHDRKLKRLERDDVLIGDGKRLIVRSPNGHFWNITVDDTGLIAATDLGASAP
jgi:hypothetical protein